MSLYAIYAALSINSLKSMRVITKKITPPTIFITLLFYLYLGYKYSLSTSYSLTILFTIIIFTSGNLLLNRSVKNMAETINKIRKGDGTREV